jgi:predicted nicotinamide N-methyase
VVARGVELDLGIDPAEVEFARFVEPGQQLLDHLDVRCHRLDYRRRVPDELVTQRIELPSGELLVQQPSESAELPDDHEVAWAPLAPYWSVLWRSGVALARELDGEPLAGLRVVELGCGLAAPSLAAARAGADVLATDADSEAVEFAQRNARLNGIELEAITADWASPDELLARAPFDLALAADVLYERQAVARLLELLPRLAPRVWLADPGRPAAGAFFEQAARDWDVETSERGVVRIHRLRLRADRDLEHAAPSRRPGR